MLTAARTDTLPIYRALRVVSARHGGSSRPALVATEAGYFFTKLRGAAQGPGALVAEIIVAALAEALGLWVPCQVLIAIDADTPSDEREDEFLDLLAASYGLSLGVQYLPGARDLRAEEAAAVPPELAGAVLWLDGLVMNCDRTILNPNLLRYQQRLWLIDHGAALPFQYRWAAVQETSPRQPYDLGQHIFAAQAPHLAAWDAYFAPRLSREVIQGAVARVPDSLLRPLVAGADAYAIERRRQAYAAFLWKRLKAPRPFVPSSKHR